MKTFKNLVINILINKLKDYEDCTFYTCDLAFELLEKYNIDGTFTYNTYKSKEIIKKYFDDFDELYSRYMEDFGNEVFVNPFSEPERFFVIMLLEQAQELLNYNNNNFIANNWNTEITLHKKNIKKLINILESEKD